VAVLLSVLFTLQSKVDGTLAETLPPGWHVRKEEPVRIPSFDEPEPDLTVVRGGIKDYSDRHPGQAPPTSLTAT